MTSTFPSLRFGSPDSIDHDRVYIFPQLPPLSECQAFCQHKDENRNIIVVRDGLVQDCFKGIPDEMNNALFHTAKHHTQTTPNPIQRPILRIVPLRVVRATRIILSLLTKTEHRSPIKAALRSYNQSERSNVLATLNFEQLSLDTESIKSIASQLGQTLALLQGHECYTKAEVIAQFPELAPHLTRSPHAHQALDVLNQLRDRINHATSDVYTRQKDTLNLFCYISSVKVRHWTPYTLQSRGLILDIKRERCVTFPYAKFFKLDEIPAWRRDALPSKEPLEIVEKVDGSFVSAYLHQGDIHFACKGNFDVEQSLRAKKISAKYDLSHLDFQRYDYTFEVIYPENRFPQGFALVEYPEESLYLTGIRDKLTHAQLPYAEIQATAQRAGLRYPQTFDHTLETLLQKAQEDAWHNFEGWVANFDGQRVKIKTTGYNKINAIINSLKHGSHRLLKDYAELSDDAWNKRISILPPEFQPTLDAELALLHQKIQSLQTHLRDWLATLSPTLSNAEYAQHILEQIQQPFHKPLFRMIRDQDPSYELRDLAVKHLLKEGKCGHPLDWDFFN